MDPQIIQQVSSTNVPLWETVITTNIIGMVLNVTFTPADEEYNYNSYKVTVWKAYKGSCSFDENVIPPPLQSCTVRKEETETTVLFKTLRLKKTEEYCSMVTPVSVYNSGTCQSGCIAITSSLFKGTYDEETKCENWSGNIDIVPQAVQKTIDFALHLEKPYLKCFDVYTTYLVNKSDCSQWTFKMENVVKQNISLKEDILRATFNEIKPGTYCIVIHPSKTDCDKVSCLGQQENYCPFRYNNKIVMTDPNSGRQDPVTIPSKKSSLKPGLSKWLTPTLLICVILTSGIVVVMWKSHRRSAQVVAEFESTNINLPVIKRDVRVFLLYSHDSPGHKNLVYLFAQFLRECCGVRVVLDVEQLQYISISKEKWLIDAVQTTCSERFSEDESEPNLDKKVIIVESQGAVESHNQKLEGKVRGDYKHSLEELFISGLSLIMANMEKCINDYCHLFVVRFPHIPESCRLRYVVPNQRYVLPDHLVELYNALHCSHKQSSTGELNVENGRLLEQWGRKMVYHTLLLEIKAAGQVDESIGSP